MKKTIYSLFVKYFLPKHSLVSGQYLKNLNDEKFRIEKCFYSQDLIPVYICTDQSGNIREVPGLGIKKLDEVDFE